MDSRAARSSWLIQFDARHAAGDDLGDPDGAPDGLEQWPGPPTTTVSGTTMEREIAATKAMNAKRVPKNSGGQLRAAKAPAPERVAVARVNAPEQAPQMVQLVSPE